MIIRAPGWRHCREIRRPSSLDEPLSGQLGAASLADRLGGEDPRIDHMLSMRALATRWGELPQREQQILLLRFRGGMTQAQIGQQLGISQMHVCRLLAHALGYLRRGPGEPERGSRQCPAAPSANGPAPSPGRPQHPGAGGDQRGLRASIPH
jgi:DNA-directed RNA polymerase specialized sigma24 family protein